MTLEELSDLLTPLVAARDRIDAKIRAIEAESASLISPLEKARAVHFGGLHFVTCDGNYHYIFMNNGMVARQCGCYCNDPDYKETGWSPEVAARYSTARLVLRSAR